MLLLYRKNSIYYYNDINKTHIDERNKNEKKEYNGHTCGDYNGGIVIISMWEK